jgi:hypothetical protein
MTRTVSLVAVALLTASLAAADPRDLDTFTSFEEGQQQGPAIGTEPERASFVGGQAQSESKGAIPHDGSWAFEIPATNTLQITFETSAATVEFFALDDDVDPDAFVEAFDEMNDQIGTRINLSTMYSSPPGDFSNPITFTGEVKTISVVNPAGGNAWLEALLRARRKSS